LTANALDLYTNEMPSHRVAFSLFEGTWASSVPGYGLGSALLFEDPRIDWLLEQCGGVAGKSVVELGPLEGGHTYMMANAGAESITSIEANSNAFLKCLLVQNALKFKADFLYGDFRPYLDECERRFDFLLASGVLYHMTDPIKVIESMANVSDSLGIWTHYYDASAPGYKERQKPYCEEAPTITTFRGKTMTTHKRHYEADLDSKNFLGGSAPYSRWMTKDTLIAALEAMDMKVTIGTDHPDHPNGPCVLLFATRV